MNRPDHSDVAIIGGGFAGCAAAATLAQNNLRPVLIEFKFKLGGRATSYSLQDWPGPLDNGQHVLLGCCAESRRFLEDMKSSDAIEWHRYLPVAVGQGRIETLRPWPIAAPFHLIPFLCRFPGITFGQRCAIAAGVLRLAVSSDRHEVEWGPLASSIGQDLDIRTAFWNPFLVSALNFEPDRVAAKYVRQFAIEAFLKSRRGIEIGIPRMPLLTLFSDRVKNVLEDSGVIMKLGKRVLRLSINPHGGFVIHLHDQSALHVRKVILATGPSIAKMILEESTGVEETAAKIAPTVGGAPIIAIHLMYDRVLMNRPFCLVRERMIQWIFNKGVHDSRQHLQAVISAADEASHQSQMELVMAADMEVREALGSDARLVTGKAFIEKDATFPPLPKITRPRVDSANHPDLFLAGDYVETGWPGTIESAIRSGRTAAEAVIRSLAAGRSSS